MKRDYKNYMYEIFFKKLPKSSHGAMVIQKSTLLMSLKKITSHVQKVLFSHKLSFSFSLPQCSPNRNPNSSPESFQSSLGASILHFKSSNQTSNLSFQPSLLTSNFIRGIKVGGFSVRFPPRVYVLGVFSPLARKSIQFGGFSLCLPPRGMMGRALLQAAMTQRTEVL
ncbi:uncharacterized protein [Euphorbia lathyris]|uniref:uncharacterized protein n=1 Tax=Euphorbia lathyris TaxID=212925 RepID=UPI003313CB72